MYLKYCNMIMRESKNVNIFLSMYFPPPKILFA